MSEYKKTHPDFGKFPLIFSNTFTEKRKQESDKILERYKDRIPIICEKSASSKLPDIDKTK